VSEQQLHAPGVPERRSAESDQALLASLVESSDDAVFSLSRDTVILSWNRGAERIFGVRTHDAIARPFDEAVGAIGDLEARREMVTQVFEEGRSFRLEGPRPLGDGRSVVLSTAVSPVHGPGGAVTAACVICRDVTAQRAAEAQERRLAAIVDSSLDPIFAVGLDGTVLSWNAAAEALYEIAARDAVGRHIDAVLPDPDGARRRLRERAAAGGTVRDEPMTRRLPDGRTLHLSTASFPLRDGDGIAGIAIIVRDVTERRRLEDRLRQTERMEAVGRLAGGIAHDFNNLLTVISGYGSIARMYVAEGAGSEELEEVQRAAARASTLTGRLLDFARQREVDPVRLDLTGVVDGVVPMLERLIGEDVRVVVLTDEMVPLVLADRGQVEQVVVNLAVNARDAMPEGGTLTIETRGVTISEGDDSGALGLPVGRWACLTVTDTGPGITPEVREHLFEPFFTTKAIGKGTGLGLATVHGIVGRAGGEVRVYSEPGMGASFKVYLPGMDRPAEPEPARASAPPRDLDGHETVLLCEDEPALAALIERILTRAGYRVLSAGTSEEALRLAAEHEGAIDVLVSDVIMPGLSGPELAQRLSQEHGPVPTLFLSGYTADVLRDRADLPTESAFLEKPFDPPALLEALRALLGG
jgi:PAS domain S-box-containing protein